MGRLSGFNHREVVKVAEHFGWELQRTQGSHLVYTKRGERRVLVIPRHRTVAEGTMRSLIRVIGIEVDQFLALAKK